MKESVQMFWTLSYYQSGVIQAVLNERDIYEENTKPAF
jgi:hypothetical protein